MKASNDTKNDAIIAALQGLVTKVNQNTNNINSLDSRVDALEQAYFVILSMLILIIKLH